MKPHLIVITSTDVETTLHRYEHKKHQGTMIFNNSEVNTVNDIKSLIEEYRLIGNKIYETTEPELA